MNKNKILTVILLLLIAITSFSSCQKDNSADITTEEIMQRITERNEKFSGKENAEDLLVKELMYLPAETLTEEMNSIIDSGYGYESLMYHAIALAQNSEDITFSYLLDEITDKNNTEATRDALLEIYDHKQRNEGTYEKGFDEIADIITDDSLGQSIRRRAVLTMLEGNEKSREKLKKCYDKVDSELQEYIDERSVYY